MKLFPIIILTVFVSCLTANAQEQDRVSDTLEVYFHQGSFTWDREYKENGKRMEEFVERFRKLHNDQTFGKISKIHIIAGCSPERGMESCGNKLELGIYTGKPRNREGIDNQQY
jgi:hypothetical protein